MIRFALSLIPNFLILIKKHFPCGTQILNGQIVEWLHIDASYDHHKDQDIEHF